MSRTKFEISRSDGRTNSEVIIDLIRDATPGTVLTFQEIGRALEANTDHRYGVVEVRAAILQSRIKVGRELKRAFRSVRGVGYKIAEAADHQLISIDHRNRARRQMQRGLHVLRHVRFDEMPEQIRNAHLGQLMISESQMLLIEGLERKQIGQERAIDAIRSHQIRQDETINRLLKKIES